MQFQQFRARKEPLGVTGSATWFSRPLRFLIIPELTVSALVPSGPQTRHISLSWCTCWFKHLLVVGGVFYVLNNWFCFVSELWNDVCHKGAIFRILKELDETEVTNIWATDCAGQWQVEEESGRWVNQASSVWIALVTCVTSRAAPPVRTAWPEFLIRA